MQRLTTPIPQNAVTNRAGDSSCIPVPHDEGKVAFLERLEQFRTYRSLLARAHVGGRLRVKVDPEDLVQETFLAAISAATTFRGPTTPNSSPGCGEFSRRAS